MNTNRIIVDGTEVAYPGVGESLPNGSVIIAEFRTFTGTEAGLPAHSSVVLAVRPGSLTPYATWRRNVLVIPGAVTPETLLDETYLGDYFGPGEKGLAEALANYCARARRVAASRRNV